MDTVKLFTNLNNILFSLEESSKYDLTKENLNTLNQFNEVINELKKNSRVLSHYSIQLLDDLPDQKVILSNQSKVQSYSSLSKKVSTILMGVGFVILILSIFSRFLNSNNMNIRLVVIIALFLSYIGEWVSQFIIRKRFGNDKTIESIKIIIEELRVA